MDTVKGLHKVDVANFQIFHQNIFIQSILISQMNKEWKLHDRNKRTRGSTGASHRKGVRDCVPTLKIRIISVHKKHVLLSQWVLLTILLKEFQ